MEFEEYCDEERGADAEHWWIYEGGGDIMRDEDRVARDEAIEKLVETGDA